MCPDAPRMDSGVRPRSIREMALLTARPSWTLSGVFSPMPVCRCAGVPVGVVVTFVKRVHERPRLPDGADRALAISGRASIPVIQFADGSHLVELSDSVLQETVASYYSGDSGAQHPVLVIPADEDVGFTCIPVFAQSASGSVPTIYASFYHCQPGRIFAAHGFEASTLPRTPSHQ